MNSDQASNSPPGRAHSSSSRADESHWRAASAAHRALLANGRDDEVAPGDIWSIADKGATPDKGLLVAVIIAVDDAVITCVPLSDEARFATEWDLMIPSIALGYDAVAQVKLAGTVASRQLDQRLSSLPSGSLQQVQELAAAAQAGISIPPAHLPLGPWVLADTDERLRARIRRASELDGYITPVLDDPIAEWQSFGSILMRSSRALGADLSTFVDLAPTALRRLQSDQLDPFSEVPARKMAALLTSLQIKWTTRVRDALYTVVFERFTPSELSQGSALGRRSKRSPRARHPQTPAQQQECERAASDYIAAIERELDVT